jgi:hypothetical protein
MTIYNFFTHCKKSVLFFSFIYGHSKVQQCSVPERTTTRFPAARYKSAVFVGQQCSVSAGKSTGFPIILIGVTLITLYLAELRTRYRSAEWYDY